MEKEFVSYEIALALKELGFDEPCFMFYWSKHKDKLIKTSLMNHIGKDKNNSDLIFDSNNTALGLKDGIFCSAPLYQQAFRWFREVYNIYVEISFNQKYENPRFGYIVRTKSSCLHTRDFPYKTYEEALKIGLQEGLKLIEIVKEK